MSYKCKLPEKEIQNLRLWQDSVYQEARQRKTQDIEFLGRKFVNPPKVHPINPMSDLLGAEVLKEVTASDIVLDMGTGCGVNAILAAGKARSVVGVDVSEASIECAKKNAVSNGLSTKISFHLSDVFDNVQGKFDVIIFDPPFRWFKARDEYEISTTDENYTVLTKFFDQLGNHLNKDGKVLLFFGTSGDIGYLNELIDNKGFSKEIIATRNLKKEGQVISYYVFRVKCCYS